MKIIKNLVLFWLFFVSVHIAGAQGRVRLYGAAPYKVGIGADTTEREVQFRPDGSAVWVQAGKTDIPVQATIDEIKLVDLGGGPGKTGTQNKTALVKAIARAAAQKIRGIYLGTGKIIIDPIDLPGGGVNDSITIRGAGPGRTFVFISNVVGDAIFNLTQARGITISDMTVDGSNAGTSASGLIRVNGSGNHIENVEFRNGKSFSLTISGRYSNGVTFINSLTQYNTVRNITITKQLYYHSTGGNATVLICDSAAHTRVENIYAYNNFPSEPGDYVGVDHAVYTYLKNIICRKTTNGFGDGAGLHLEGEQAYDNMYVTVDGLTVINMLVGTSVSENSKATFIGQNRMVGCKYPIKAYNDHKSFYSNFELIKCGSGLGSSDTEGLIMIAKSGIFKNIRTTGTLAKLAVSAYNGTPENSVSTPIEIEDCEFDAIVQASYGNLASYYVNIARTRFNNTSLNWYNNTGLKITVNDCFFNNSKINGARNSDARIYGNTFVGSGPGTAVELTLDNFNTTLTNNRFYNYAYVHANATLGLDNKWSGITNPPVGDFSIIPDALVQGNAHSRSKWISTITGVDLKSGFYAINGTTGTTGMPADPFSLDFWHLRVTRGENSAGTLGPWKLYEATNFDGSKDLFWVFRDQGDGVMDAPIERVTTKWFTLNRSIGNTDGHFLKNVSGTWTNVAPVWADLSSVKTSSSTTIDMASIAAGASTTFTITVTGAVAGSGYILAPPSTLEAGLQFSASVTATNTVTVRVTNTTGSSIDPASASWKASTIALP